MSFDHPSFGRIDDERVIVFDTTLRDGEQSPGFSMTLSEKLRMAHALAELGVDVIEAGFPITSNDDFQSVRTIAREVRGPVIAGLCRAHPADILRAAEAFEATERARIHIVIATSPLHMAVKLRMTPEQVLEATRASVTLARNHCADVEWSAEDGTRSEPDFLCRVVEVAIDAGATTINIPDTVGYALPDETRALFELLRARVPNADRAIFSTHNHNDLGLGVANTLAGLQGGARQVEVAVNGIGERAGNAALEEVAMALRVRRNGLNLQHGIVTENLVKTSKLLSTLTGFDVQPNKAIVGRNAFAHESGIHQDGILKDANTYEIMTPASVGWSRSSLVLGKHSGRAAFRAKLVELGYENLGENRVQDAFKRFKDLADKKKVVFEDDLIALVDEEVVRDHERVRFVELQVRTGSKGPAHAELEIMVDGERRTAMATGDGGVDAAFNALRDVFPHRAALTLYSVGAITEGTDAQARTTVRLDENGRTVDGQGADTDTIVAAVRAYVHALNKLLVKRERHTPEAMSA